jgi:pSer/pThr/pTyr-binding forkhead associated (FHA) protein
LILDDRLISRRHAEIKFIDNNLVIEDLASTNGTKVNGKNVKKKQLVPNDLISIGPANLRIQHSL